MLYTYDIKKEDMYNYNYVFLKKVNKSYDEKTILTFSIALLIVFFIVSYFSITPSFLFISTKSNITFLTIIIISVCLLYLTINKFFKQLNYMITKDNDIIINDFFKDGYIVQVNDLVKTIEISTKCLCISLNLLKDVNKVYVFKDFISTSSNGINIFFPKEDNILSLFKECNLI